MKTLRVGVVGSGYLGTFHAQKYARMPDVKLVGVVDTDPSRAASVAAEHGTAAFTDHRALFGQVDAVSIVTPTPSHFGIGMDFLMHGVDIMVEKPMTTTLAEADELIRIAEERDRIIQVGHLERFNSAVAALKDVVHRPMFIESHRLSLFKERCTDVSVVLDLMIHDIDIILNIVKSDVTSIHAAGVAAVSREIDIANARLEFSSGCVANVTASRISMKNQRKIRMFQKNAYISVDFASHEIMVIRKVAEQTAGPIPGMTVDQRCFTNCDALDDELKSFVLSVKARRTPEVTGQMGRDALKVALSVMAQINETNARFLEA